MGLFGAAVTTAPPWHSAARSATRQLEQITISNERSAGLVNRVH